MLIFWQRNESARDDGRRGRAFQTKHKIMKLNTFLPLAALTLSAALFSGCQAYVHTGAGFRIGNPGGSNPDSDRREQRGPRSWARDDDGGCPPDSDASFYDEPAGPVLHYKYFVGPFGLGWYWESRKAANGSQWNWCEDQQHPRRQTAQN